MGGPNDRYEDKAERVVERQITARGAPLSNRDLNDLEDTADHYAKQLSAMLRGEPIVTTEEPLRKTVSLLYRIVRERRPLRK